jgi:hypothetical protein
MGKRIAGYNYGRELTYLNKYFAALHFAVKVQSVEHHNVEKTFFLIGTDGAILKAYPFRGARGNVGLSAAYNGLFTQTVIFSVRCDSCIRHRTKNRILPICIFLMLANKSG